MRRDVTAADDEPPLADARCRVIAPFVDAAGRRHDVGEHWRLIRADVTAAGRTIVLIVCGDDAIERPIPLGWDADVQQDVIEHPERYLEAAGDADADRPAVADAVASWGRTLGRMWRQRFPEHRG